MSKQRRIKQTAVNSIPRVEGRTTREPEVANNWPYGHADIKETSDDEEGECFIITIHGIDHYLHATTVYELYKKMGKIIPEWDKKAKEHGAPGVIE